MSGVWLIGAGGMARAYAAVVQAQGRDVTVVGLHESSATEFAEQTGLDVRTGGFHAFLEGFAGSAVPAIIATPVDTLADMCLDALEHGVKRILVEKPAGLDEAEIRNVAEAAARRDAEIYVAYNRRHYASVLAARDMINEDGGVTSFSFEFTEFGDRIAQSQQPAHVKRAWFMANSTHVVDLAFFLGGRPRELAPYVAGSLDWHPAAAAFAGAGINDAGAPFTYQANWDAPGRWGVEVLTRARRLILRPLEELQVQHRNSVAMARVTIDDALDRDFKPGLYRQVSAFLDGGDGASSLQTIADHSTATVNVYTPMLTGTLSPDHTA